MKSNAKRWTLDERVAVYLRIVFEVQQRALSIQYLAKEIDAPGIAPYHKIEFMFLHVRKICELLAIGCASLHSIRTSLSGKDDGSRYRADLILKMIGDHHYPRAIEDAPEPGKLPKEFVVKTPQPLDRQTLKRFYLFADKLLHVGKIREVLFDTKTADTVCDPGEFADRVLKHLITHTVKLDTDKRMMLVWLMPSGDPPGCSIWETP